MLYLIAFGFGFLTGGLIALKVKMDFKWSLLTRLLIGAGFAALCFASMLGARHQTLALGQYAAVFLFATWFAFFGFIAYALTNMVLPKKW